MKIQTSLSLTILLCLGLSTVSFSQILLVEGLHHPESVAVDGGMMYVADIGKEMTPNNKDGDGYIALYKKDGQPVNAAFITGLDAPKGLAIQGNILVACDVDQLRVFDKKTGKQTKSILFPKTQFLNDFVFTGPNVGYITSTDLNTVYKVFLETGKFTPVTTNERMIGPNGLAYDAQKNVVMMVEYGTQAEPGHIMEIDLKTGKVAPKGGIKGGLDGIGITKEGALLVTDWGTPPNGQLILVSLTEGKNLLKTPVGGPADFHLDAATKTVYLPAMLEGKVYMITY